MANILYGVNGQGAGHSSRSREVLEHLRSRGHSVHVVSFDRGLKNLAPDFEVTEVYGLRLSMSHNRVRYAGTILKNLVGVPQAARSVRRVSRLAEDKNIQLVITDFEPISCHLGHKLGLPILSIDNQHCLNYGVISYPRQYRSEAAAAKMVSRLMTPRADAYFITSFFTPRSKNKRAFFFPPILRQEVLDSTPSEGEAVLVYVTSPAANLADLLKRVRQRFICYGFGREGQDGNVSFKKPNQEEFLRDLRDAKAVVANSGFSLISEALYLNKPYLAWPVKNQFEQVFNAYYVDKMGFGAYWDELNKERVESFLFNIPNYRKNLAHYPRKDNSELFAKLDEWIAGR